MAAASRRITLKPSLGTAKAAWQGNAAAQYEYANSLDYVEAVAWLQQAAEQGNAAAQHELGGVPPSPPMTALCLRSTGSSVHRYCLADGDPSSPGFRSDEGRCANRAQTDQSPESPSLPHAWGTLRKWNGPAL